MFAHSRNAAGARHPLVDHLRATADLTSSFMEPLGAPDLGRYLGLWHDVGKLDPAWQQYLLDAEAGRTRSGHGPDHKAAGTFLAKSLGPVALAIQGHHGGLQPGSGLGAWLNDKVALPGAQAALRLAQGLLPDLHPATPPPLPAHLMRRSSPREADAARRSAEVFVRLAFSALVDADSLDTETHASDQRAALRGNDVSIADLLVRFEAAQARRAPSPSPAVQHTRDAILAACQRAADLPPGLFRLAAPTGGGKTLSAMAFALRHARKHGRRRVVVAVPFISITEQTAQVYRDIFGPSDDGRPVVLEHHSGNADLAHADRADDAGDVTPEALWSALAAENWDAPVVVTTTVQLFESLFGRTRTACRKLHRLARAVIVLDEVQALPFHLLAPILDVLRELCAHYGTTVLLSTATQPAFESLDVLRDLPAHDILPDPAPHFRALQRVRYEWHTDTPLAWPAVADLIRDEPRSLTILNTKDDALALLDALDALDALGHLDALHLSTLLCGAHRRQVLAQVRQRLAAGAPCTLVSTQVVEAGVDLDFPLVLRALGPLDAIIQAAGRCNREGRLGIGPAAGGRTIVFRPETGGMPPGTYRLAAQATLAALHAAALDNRPLDLDDPALFRRNSRELLALTNPDAAEIQRLRASLDYPEVARQFRMIDDDTESLVITQYGSDDERQAVRDLLDAIRNPGPASPSPRVVLRQLQPYVVTVRRRQAEQYRRRGLIEDIHPANRPDVSLGISEWHGRYHSARGLVTEGPGADIFVI
jgi:CRISPR-associated endonuclease/helicase Cas3